MKINGLLYFKSGEIREFSKEIINDNLPFNHSVPFFQLIETHPSVEGIINSPNFLFKLFEVKINQDFSYYVSYKEF